jgi:acyl-CoA reductase-like NAD-dependent aldehyde dehydrogenase
MEITNPYDDSVIETVRESSEQDVYDAISRAVQVAPTMADMPAHRRAAILTNAAQIIEAQGEALAKIMAQESGKPIKLARGEASRCVETFQFAADEARRAHGETVPMDAAKSGVGKIGYYVRQPVGVVGAITPFNFPLNLVAHKIAPAIAAGCPLVLKPSPKTPLTALRLAEILLEAGLPENAYQVVIGDVAVGNALVTDPRIAMITFTGSPGVARAISKNIGLRRLALELGGNAATIITEDGNVDHAVERNTIGGYAYAGQTCISVQRIYVHRSRYDEFRDKYVDSVKKIKLGNPLEEDTDLGPLINEVAAERLENWLTEAVDEGANVLTGGGRDGKLFQPTLLDNVDESMQVMCNEVFGPIVSLMPYDDFDTAITAVNTSPFGLQSGIYTNDLNKAMYAVNKLNVGGVMINDVPSYRADHMPYGGVKDSGVGREGPRFAVEEMTTVKMVVITTGV